MKKNYFNFLTRPIPWPSLLIMAIFGLLMAIPGMAQTLQRSGMDGRVDSNSLESISIERAALTQLRNSTTTTTSSLLEECEQESAEFGFLLSQLADFIFADDLMVAPETTFQLEEINAYIAKEVAANMTSVNVTLWNDNNGRPGAEIPLTVAPTWELVNLGAANSSKNLYALVVEFPDPIVLSGGISGARYWVGIQAPNTGTAGYLSSALTHGSEFYISSNGISWTSATSAYDGALGNDTDLALDFFGQCDDIVTDCPRPTDITLLNKTSSGLNVEWTVGGNESNWTVSWGPVGFTPGGAGQLGTGTATAPTFGISGLEAYKKYEIYVRAVCAADSQSSWSGPFNAVTLGDGIGDGILSQNTDQVFTNNGVTCPGGPNWWMRSYALSDHGITSDVWVTGIQFALSTTQSNEQLAFYAYDYTDFPNGFDIDNPPAPIASTTMTIGPANNHSIIDVEFDSPGLAVAGSNIVVAVVQLTQTGNTIYLETTSDDTVTSYLAAGRCSISVPTPVGDINFETAKHLINLVVANEVPVCLRPYNFTVDSLASTTAEISWTAGGNETEWIVVYGAVGMDPDNPDDLEVVTGTPSVTLTGLDGATEYEVYVQAACLDNEYSDWAGPLVFETPCSVIDVFPWTESFEGDICWTVAAISGINNWNLVQQNSSGNITPRTGAYMAEFRSSTEGDAALLISPTLDLSGLTTPELSFYFANENWFGDIDELGLLYRGNDEDNFISIDEVFFDTEHAQWTKVTIDLPNPSATYQIAFYGYSNWARGVNIDDVTIQEKVYNYVYENGMWSPEHPNVSAIGTDRITVVNGIATGEDAINSDLAIDAITIMSGATLEINSVLTLNGDLIVDGDLIFGSGPNFDGQLGFIGENATITGAVTVHRYMSENRAYRMVSSPVTTSDFIRDNWQEGINNLDYNNNPNPGYGTHITGSNYNLGFDVTATGNPSLFTVDIPSQSFVAVPNTSATSMDAGDAFLMFVRGDRGIDLNDNSASGTTILRTKGMLFTGDKTQNYSVSAGDFVMFGNPYQSALDVEKVLGASSNVNSNHYYVYDPTFGEQGKYVTVDFVIGGEEGSEANQYLQPGQAAQFIVGGAGTVSLTIKEEHKEPGEHSATHRGAVIDNLLTVQLYTTENFSEGGKDHDSFRMLFDSSFSNDISQEDAVMPFNFNENLGINNGGTYLSIERRKMPVQDEVFQLYTQGYSHSDYTFKLTLNGVEDVSLYFEDRFTGAIERIEQGENTFAFNVDSNSSGSLAEDRFVIRADRPLHIDDKDLLHFNLYPNPIEDNSFYIQSSGFQGQSVEVTITDVTGKRFFHEVIETPSNKVFITTKTTLAAGVYFLNLKHQNGTSTIKLIKE